MNVFILATCRKPELLDYTLLVFKTLRVGFPNACVRVFANSMSTQTERLLREVVAGVGGETERVVGTEPRPYETIHHEWIEGLLREETEPFYLLDTDVIFYESFERESFDTALAGYRVPEFHDAFSGALTRARLHTGLLYVNPALVREQVARFASTLPDGPFTPLANLAYPLCLPFKRQMMFYDTCSLLYHAIGGTAFTDAQKDRYLHFNFGTISDLVLARLPADEAKSLQARRDHILRQPLLGRGAWREQDQYYASHQ